MANKYHNGKNGPAICRAKTRTCRFGGANGEENHYSTKEEAQLAYDRQMETNKDYIIGSHKITDSSIVTNMKFKDDVMEIEYSNGESVAYSSNKEEADEFLKSESKGRYLQNIKQNKIGLVKTGIISHENGIKDKTFIDSSFLSGSAHLDNHNYLVVDFKNGKRYLYNNINSEIAHNFMVAENKGAYFSEYIKGNEVTSNNITLEESEIIHNNFGIDVSKFKEGEAISVDISENSPKEYNQNESRVEFLNKNILNKNTIKKTKEELIEEIVEFAHKNDLGNVVELQDDGSLFIYSHSNESTHNFYVVVTEDGKLAIEHYSDSNVVLYTKDSNNEDFTPESAIKTILENVKSLENEDVLKKEYPKLSYQEAKGVKEFLDDSNILDNEYFNMSIESDKVRMEDGYIKIPFKLQEEEFTREQLGVWGYGFGKNSAEVTNVRMTGEIYLDPEEKSVGINSYAVDVNYDLVSGVNYSGLKSDVVYDTIEHQFISRIEDYSNYEMNYDL